MTTGAVSYLVAGLGNPGKKYALTRHNIGFMVIDKLVEKSSLNLDKKKFDAVFGTGTLGGNKVLLAKPMAFMNNSGQPLLALARYFKVPAGQMIIIHDDIDLAWGRIKIKTDGGHGGHKGIQSIMETFGLNNFTRVRIGIDHPGESDRVVGHVLGKLTTSETVAAGRIITMAREAVITILEKGEKVAMDQIHGAWPKGIS
ncbi:MAG: aminoacyl-tRNA hydrolase [Desulfosudaceae bacterium]